MLNWRMLYHVSVLWVSWRKKQWLNSVRIHWIRLQVSLLEEGNWTGGNNSYNDHSETLLLDLLGYLYNLLLHPLYLLLDALFVPSILSVKTRIHASHCVDQRQCHCTCDESYDQLTIYGENRDCHEIAILFTAIFFTAILLTAILLTAKFLENSSRKLGVGLKMYKPINAVLSTHSVANHEKDSEEESSLVRTMTPESMASSCDTESSPEHEDWTCKECLPLNASGDEDKVQTVQVDHMPKYHEW